MFRRPWHRLIAGLFVPVAISGNIVFAPAPKALAAPTAASAEYYNFFPGNVRGSFSEELRDHRPVKRLRAFEWAKDQIGCPYVWGGAGPCSNGYDCSGLVMAAYSTVDIYLPHNTQMMVDSGKLVRLWHPRKWARKGDLVMYFSWGTAYHVGVVAYKTNWMIDAPSPGQNVQRQEIWGNPVYYRVKHSGS